MDSRHLTTDSCHLPKFSGYLSKNCGNLYHYSYHSHTNSGDLSNCRNLCANVPHVTANCHYSTSHTCHSFSDIYHSSAHAHHSSADTHHSTTNSRHLTTDLSYFSTNLLPSSRNSLQISIRSYQLSAHLFPLSRNPGSMMESNEGLLRLRFYCVLKHLSRCPTALFLYFFPELNVNKDFSDFIVHYLRTDI